jgi:hypothetical protein
LSLAARGGAEAVRAYVTQKAISVPKPVTRRALHVYLHEVAHVVLEHCPLGKGGGKPRHVEEYEAEQWAFNVMRAEGVPIPRKSMASAKSYVARKIRQAERRGAKKIDARAKAFAR